MVDKAGFGSRRWKLPSNVILKTVNHTVDIDCIFLYKDRISKMMVSMEEKIITGIKT
jgi:hypothetical protein